MFSFYGAKTKLVQRDLYRPPQFDHVVEPFAGSARYALRYFDREVTLYDLSDHVITVWEYLKTASRADVLGLPDVPSKVHIDNYELTDAEKYLIGFCLCRGKARPRKTGHGLNSWSRDKIRIANDLWKIRHWNVVQASYTTIPNRVATYFVDPPYRQTCTVANGDRYEHSAVDYEHLGRWCRRRRGQVIACEGAAELYLSFRPLIETSANSNNHGAKRYTEYVWNNRVRVVQAID